MYIIVVYDIGVKRVNKMLKLCRLYLHWIQNSVFEGEITEGRLNEMLMKAKKIMDKEEDSLIIFKNECINGMEKIIVGKERSAIDNFL